MDFVGTAGRDRFVGETTVRGADNFHLEQGGNDIVSGRGGYDRFYFGAELNAKDRVNGGSANDIIYLNGDYSNGLVLSSDWFSNIEDLELSGGTYRISGVLDSMNSYGETVVYASLPTRYFLDLDVSTLGRLHANGGDGNDILRASSNGNDSIIEGYDGNDTLIGNDGVSVMHGWAGSDRIIMAGAENVAYYSMASHSTRGAIDRIENFEASGGKVELRFDSNTATPALDFDFHFGRTAGHAGDMIVTYNEARDITVLRVFTDGDGTADFFLHFTGQVNLTTADFIFG